MSANQMSAAWLKALRQAERDEIHGPTITLPITKDYAFEGSCGPVRRHPKEPHAIRVD